jgi:Rad3-related DNA helicase
MSAIVPAVALTAIFVAIRHLVGIHRKNHPAEIPATNPDHPESLSIDEVSRILDAAQAHATEELDWRSGIVDLQKLLGNDASRAARRELWANFGVIGDYTGTAEQNVELHRLVMEEIARGAIKVPDTD